MNQVKIIKEKTTFEKLKENDLFLWCDAPEGATKIEWQKVSINEDHDVPFNAVDSIRKHIHTKLADKWEVEKLCYIKPVEGDYIQLLDAENKPCENFTYVGKVRNYYGIGNFLISDGHGIDYMITRNEDFDCSIFNGWVQVIL